MQNDSSQKQTFQTANVLTVSFAHFIHDVYSSFLAPILPIIIERLGITYSAAGLLTIIQRVPSFFNFLIGILADRLRVRFLLIVAPAITALSMSLLGLASTYWMLALLLFIMGISASAFHVPAPVLIRKISGKRTGEGMSYYMVGGEFARAVGPIVILSAVAWWGLEGSWRLFPVGLGASVILYLRFRNMPISDNISRGRPYEKVWDSFKKHMFFFSMLTGYTFARAILKSTLSVFLPVFLTDQGSSLWISGISLSVFEIAGVAGVLVMGKFSDKLGRRFMLIIAAVFSPLFTWLFLITDGSMRFGMLMFLGFFIFSSTPVVLALVQELKSDRPSFMNGLYMTISFTTGAIAVFLSGLLADITSIETAFYMCIFSSAAAIPFAFFLRAGKKKDNSEK